MAKQKKELKPEILERDESDIDPGMLKNIAEDIEQATVRVRSDENETFFKTVAKSMDDKKNISFNTEYLSVPENFTGTRLSFLAEYAFMPMLEGFVEKFEVKRVSLQRKGRQEKVMIMQERQRIEQEERMQDINKLFNVNPT